MFCTFHLLSIFQIPICFRPPLSSTQLLTHSRTPPHHSLHSHTFLVFTCISADLVSLLSNILHPCILTHALLIPPSRNRFPLYPAPITWIYPRHLMRSHILTASVLGDFPHPDLLSISPLNLCAVRAHHSGLRTVSRKQHQQTLICLYRMGPLEYSIS